MARWLVDAHNVIGSRPDGWWRDRDGAARRLVAAVREWAAAEGASALVVLDAAPADLEGAAEGVELAIAPERGRNAGDDELIRRLEREPAPGTVRVVTSDAAL